MKKRFVKIFVCIAVICILVCVPAMAGNSNFTFDLSLSGRTYIPDWNSGNNKIHPWDNWIVRVDYMRYSAPSQLPGTLGTAFIPAYYSAMEFTWCGSPQWAKTTGRYGQGYWDSGSIGTRYLMARQDDLLTCTSSTYGVWNADTNP